MQTNRRFLYSNHWEVKVSRQVVFFLFLFLVTCKKTLGKSSLPPILTIYVFSFFFEEVKRSRTISLVTWVVATNENTKQCNAFLGVYRSVPDRLHSDFFLPLLYYFYIFCCVFTFLLALLFITKLAVQKVPPFSSSRFRSASFARLGTSQKCNESWCCYYFASCYSMYECSQEALRNVHHENSFKKRKRELIIISTWFR